MEWILIGLWLIYIVWALAIRNSLSKSINQSENDYDKILKRIKQLEKEVHEIKRVTTIKDINLEILRTYIIKASDNQLKLARQNEIIVGDRGANLHLDYKRSLESREDWALWVS